MKLVYSFDENNNKINKKLLGGKGMGLCKMTELKLPIPHGFIITTAICKQYYKNNKKLSQTLIQQVKYHIKKMEKITGKKLNSDVDPLLVSVRSGAAISMYFM